MLAPAFFEHSSRQISLREQFAVSSLFKLLPLLMDLTVLWGACILASRSEL